MAEHKALMERFASSVNAAALAAAAAQQAAHAAAQSETKEEEIKKPSNLNVPMDLSKREDDEDLDVGDDAEAKESPEEDLSFRKIVIKSDLNRNTVVQQDTSSSNNSDKE